MILIIKRFSEALFAFFALKKDSPACDILEIQKTKGINFTMFYSLKGMVEEVHPDHLIIDTPVFGYKVYTASVSLRDMAKPGKEIKLYLYPVYKEDDVQLFGFADTASRDIFEMITKISGIGPKTAAQVLNQFTPSGLVSAVRSGDAKAITKVPGIGPKGAQRMILELKDKIDKLGVPSLEASAPSASAPSDKMRAEDRLSNEAADALTALGFSFAEAQTMISGAMEEGMDLEDLIKKALMNLNS